MATLNHQRGTVGALRRRLVLEAPAAAEDGIGGRVSAFTTVAAVWANIETLSGEERWRAGRPEQALTHRVTLRWRDGVTAGHRLRDAASTFDIQAVTDPDGARRRLVCLVEEVGP